MGNELNAQSAKDKVLEFLSEIPIDREAAKASGYIRTVSIEAHTRGEVYKILRDSGLVTISYNGNDVAYKLNTLNYKHCLIVHPSFFSSVVLSFEVVLTYQEKTNFKKS